MSILCNKPRDYIIQRLSAIDLVCSDLDECVFPFFTQALVSGELFFESIFIKDNRKYFSQLGAGAIYLIWLFLISFGNLKRFGNNFLMHRFSKTMRGIPMSNIKKHSQYIHSFFYAGSIDLFNAFHSKNIPTVILSLSIQPIIDVMCENIQSISEGYGNKIKTFLNDEVVRFDTYAEPKMIGPLDKLICFNAICEKYKSKHPLVIGHSKDELMLAEKARCMDGLSIGINPKKYKNEFDIVVNSQNWKELVVFLSNITKE